MRESLKRTFTAIDILPGPEMIGHLDAIRGRLAGSSMKWTDPRNLHLTLNFLGDTPEGIIPSLAEDMQQSLAYVPSFILRLHSAGVFRNLRQPRIIWAGCSPLSTLSHIHDLLSGAVAKSGFREDDRTFTPHLTLGRIREPIAKERLERTIAEYEGFTFHEQEVDHLVFYESILKAGGPEYKVLHRLDLGGA